MCLKCCKTYCFVPMLGVFVLSWPTSRSGHLQKPFRNAKKALFRRFWGLPGGHTGRVTGFRAVARSPPRSSPSSHYTPLELKLLLNSTRREALSVTWPLHGNGKSLSVITSERKCKCISFRFISFSFRFNFVSFRFNFVSF